MNFIQRKYGLLRGIWENEVKSSSNPFSLWDTFCFYGCWDEFIPEFIADFFGRHTIRIHYYKEEKYGYWVDYYEND